MIGSSGGQRWRIKSSAWRAVTSDRIQGRCYHSNCIDPLSSNALTPHLQTRGAALDRFQWWTATSDQIRCEWRWWTVTADRIQWWTATGDQIQCEWGWWTDMDSVVNSNGGSDSLVDNDGGSDSVVDSDGGLGPVWMTVVDCDGGSDSGS